MTIKEIRYQTGLSQSKFASMFHIPVATVKDWEQGRRNPPSYVIEMIKTILEYRGIAIDENYIASCEERRKQVERMLAILLTATNGPDKKFMDALDDYIYGRITLDKMEENVDKLVYLGA